MPRLAVTSTLRARLSPEEQQIVTMLVAFVNEVRLALELPPVTDEAIEARLRELAGVATRVAHEGMP